MDKDKLTKDVWSKDNYYKTAGQGSMDVTHPAMKKLKGLAKDSVDILDMGCGEGTRLVKIAGKDNHGFGIDISRKAIGIAKKKYPQFDFRVGDLEKLPFSDNKFDLVYSAFTFEHLDNPETVLGEAVRVLKKGGSFLIVAPNFGAPNRASPPFKGSRFLKLIMGFAKDFLHGDKLSWNKVKPIASADKYEIDWDTTVEPYVGSLAGYFKRCGLAITYSSSCWSLEQSGASFFQKTIKKLGEAGVYPFKNWGPHMLLIAKK